MHWPYSHILLKLCCKIVTEDNIKVRIIPAIERGKDYSEGSRWVNGKEKLGKVKYWFRMVTDNLKSLFWQYVQCSHQNTILEVLIPAKPQSFTCDLKLISNQVYLLENPKDNFKRRGVKCI